MLSFMLVPLFSIMYVISIDGPYHRKLIPTLWVLSLTFPFEQILYKSTSTNRNKFITSTMLCRKPKRNDLHKFYFPPYWYSYNNYIASGVFSLAYIITKIDKNGIFHNKEVNGNCFSI